MPKKYVEYYCKRYKFSLYYDKYNPDKELMCSIKINKSLIGLYDEIRVIVEFEDDKVKSSRGWLFFHAS